MTIIKRERIDDWEMVTVDTPRGDCLVTKWPSMTDDEVLDVAKIWIEADYGF